MKTETQPPILTFCFLLSAFCCAHAAAPIIAAIPDQTVYVDHPALVELLVSDAETATNLLGLKLTTSNPALIDTNKNVVFHWFTDGGSAMPRWYMTVAPTFGLTGKATNTVTVSDGSNTVSASFVLTVVPPPVHAARFVNTNQITLPNSGIASQYPSTTAVSGMVGTITDIVVTLSHLTHTNPNDLHMLLVSPTGRGMVFWSKVGGGGPWGGVPPDHAVSNVTATVTDAAPDWSPLPPFYFIWTERFRPGDYAATEAPANNFPAPAPAGPYAPVPVTNAFHEAFAGLNANGTWSLYIYDDAAPYGGRIANGWSLTVTTTGPLPPTITDIANQTILTNTSTAALPFTIADADTAIGSLTLSNASSNTLLVPTNNIVFGGSGSNRTVTVTPAAGQAGTSTISVFVSDGTNTSSDTFLLTVLATLPVTQSFTNAAAITIRDTNSALPYPSTLAVSGFSGVVSNVTVTLQGFNQSWGSDVDVLLVGPTGQKVMLMSDAASGFINNITFTLSDAAATGMPASGLPAGTYLPTNLTDDSPLGDDFPAPAPAGPHGTALSVFQNTTPNGTWSLYVFDDGPGDIGNFSGGWSMTLTTITGAPSNTAPTISAITNQITTVNTPETGIAFTMGDAQTTASNLVLSATSANATLVPTSNITFGGSGANRTVTITPASNQLGTATITLIVSDGTLSASNSFVQTVNPASLVITENSASRIYGATNPVLTGSITGLQAGDVITAGFTSAAATNSPVGAYPISFTLSDPGSKLGNYIVTTNNGTLTVTNAPLTVTENSASRSYGATNPPLTGSVTGLHVGDNITANFSSSAATNSPIGAYPISFTLFDPGSRLGNYSLTTNNGTLTVDAANLLITAAGTNKAYGTTLNPAAFTAAGLINGDSVTNVTLASAGSVSNAAVGSYDITAGGASGVGLTNYAIGYSNGTMTVGAASLLITAADTNKVYGALLNPTEFTTTGLLNNDSVTSVNLSSAGSGTNAPVGSYVINAASALGDGLANYTIAYSNGTMTVGTANLLITAADTNKVYGALLNPTEFTATGLLNSDSVTNVNLSSAGSETNAPVGSHAINAASALGAGLANYTIGYSNGTLTVAQAVLTATADDKSRAYGQPNPAFTISITGFMNGDGTNMLNSLPLASTTATNTTAPGNYPITPAGGTDDNYSFSLVSGSLSIAPPGVLTITTIEMLDPNTVRVAGTGDANVIYTVQKSSDLVAWEALGTATADGSGTFEFIDSTAGAMLQRFYRLATP